VTYREWGDGATRRTEHVIARVSFADGTCVCDCGVTITEPNGNAALEQAWDLHRGLTTLRATRYAEQATDDDVRDFLAALEDPAYIPPVFADMAFAESDML
jgi:hypothetical protein